MRPLLPWTFAALLCGCVTNTNVPMASAIGAGGSGGAAPPRRIVVVHRTAPVFVAASGKPSRLASAFSLHPDCSLNDYITVRVLAAPTHGTATVERGRFYPTYPRTNDRSACNAHPAEGTVVWYRSEPGYVGSDAVELEIIETDGRAGRVDYHIEVK